MTEENKDSSLGEEIIVEEVIEVETESSTTIPSESSSVYNVYYRPFSFGDSISRGFKGYFNFKGRAARSEYWWWYLFTNIVLFAALTVDILFFFVSGWPFPLLFSFLSLTLIIPSLAVSVRRLHDRNMTGWFILVGLLPFGFIALFVFYILEGDKFTNNYGINPLEENSILRPV